MKTRMAIWFFAAATLTPHGVQAQINGFTEPFRRIELASDEAGSIAELYVQEGSSVAEGDVIARLDDRVQQLHVEAAQHLAGSTSSLEAARMVMQKRIVIAERIERLIASGHATESERIRAELERAIAEAKFLAAEEERVGREIDLRRAQVQLDRRSIRAPFSGVVSQVHRQQGEFLSPLKPEVVTLIQVDTLLAVFNVPSEQVNSFPVGREYSISFNDGQMVTGSIYQVGVQTDAESGTVQIKLQIDNSDQRIRSGEQCYLEL